MSGVSPSDESSRFSHYERQFRKLQDDTADEKKRIEKRNEEQLAKMDASYRDELRKQADAHERAFDTLKEDTNDSLNRERKSHAYELARQQDIGRNFIYDSKGKFNHIDSEAKEQQLREMADSVEKVRYKSDADREQLEKIQSQHLHEHADDAEKATDQLRQTHAEETDKLRQNLKELSTMNRDMEKKKGEALAQSVRENENEWLMKQRRLNEGFETDLDHIRRANADTESKMTQKSHEAIRDNERNFTEIIQNQNLQAHKNLKTAENAFADEIKNMEKTRAKENASIQAAHSARMEESHKQRDEALEAQAKAGQSTLSRQRQADDETIQALQKELSHARRPDDPSNISPAAEAMLRKSLVKHYDKSLQAEVDRNRESQDHTLKTHAEKVRILNNEKEDTITNLNRDNATQRTNERSLFMNQLYENEEDKKSSLTRAEQEHLRGNEKLTRHYAILMERQRRDYENIIGDLQSKKSTRLYEERQDADFKMKMAQRAASERQSEIVHDYEKQLADQKVEFDFKMDDIKTQARLDLKEAERRTKQALEEQARSYEQRIAQLESQSKERERYLSQTHQDELDKVRRSNALLLQKKG